MTDTSPVAKRGQTDLHFTLRRVLSNGQDLDVVERLLTSGPDKEKIDALSPDSPVPRSMRVAVAYIRAAHARHTAIATRDQISLAKRALSGLRRAQACLSQIVPEEVRSLAAAIGLPVNDLKGIDETNELTAVCDEVLVRGLTESIFKLEAALDRERRKPGRVGERKKRLRSIVESLVELWVEEHGRMPAVVPLSSKTSKNPDLLGHEGPFLDLARAVLCVIDQFNDSEVVATVQDVLEKQRSDVTQV